MKKQLLVLVIVLFLAAPLVSAENPFTDWFTRPIENTFNGLQVFLLDFLAILFDVFAIILFILWIAIIGGIGYGVYWVVTLPKRLGAENFNDAVLSLSHKFWNMIK